MEIREFNIDFEVMYKTKNDRVTIIQKDKDTTSLNISVANYDEKIELDKLKEIKVVFGDNTGKVVEMNKFSIINNVIRCILNDEVMNMSVGEIQVEIVLYGDNTRLTVKTEQFLHMLK